MKKKCPDCGCVLSVRSKRIRCPVCAKKRHLKMFRDYAKNIKAAYFVEIERAKQEEQKRIREKELLTYDVEAWSDFVLNQFLK
jgi:uncharacterized Zn finger protein (UPF0148 family)